MVEISYKIGCNNCGRYIEANLKSGIFDFGKVTDEELPHWLNQICVCNSNKKKK